MCVCVRACAHARMHACIHAHVEVWVVGGKAKSL